jgi:hypothetical protein
VRFTLNTDRWRLDYSTGDSSMSRRRSLEEVKTATGEKLTDNLEGLSGRRDFLTGINQPPTETRLRLREEANISINYAPLNGYRS